MSECVVRMKMPEACVWRDDKGHIKMCPLYWEDEARCQGKDGKEAPWYDGKRPDWCPIICQLPEGHGRLVDVTKIDFVMFTNEASTFRCGWNNGVRSVMQHAETIVPAAPKEENKDDGH